MTMFFPDETTTPVFNRCIDILKNGCIEIPCIEISKRGIVWDVLISHSIFGTLPGSRVPSHLDPTVARFQEREIDQTLLGGRRGCYWTSGCR
jgi:hypothetical protein